ncbi:hypothetical protein [Burkholderia cepacia]|uniref:hypothetical protein n=1 Tax=Burkholderia cepacia TaxID=292 RepID=UPI00298F4ACA|nr:hypothetical protein [Burkholderia cepacia]
MNEQHIQPHKITKPMQLLAAWLVGLILINATFLGAAANFGRDAWESGVLVIASIVNVPIFLFALFVLQTKFRAELQEDSFYSDYLSKKTASIFRIGKSSHSDGKLEEIEAQVIRLSAAAQPQGVHAESEGDLDWAMWRVGLNALHPKFKEIREALRASSIPLAELFGGGGECPEKWIVALSHVLPAAHKAKILKVVLPFGFEGINFGPRSAMLVKLRMYILEAMGLQNTLR